MFKQKLFIAAALTCLASSNAFADASVVGLWKTIDDGTGAEKALIRITEKNGEYKGKIEKLFPAPGESANRVCDKCEGALKDRPLVGLTTITGLKDDGDGSGSKVDGGEIIDPDNGKVYKCKMAVKDNGKKLEVRGYIGVPLLGRSQTWLRAE